MMIIYQPSTLDVSSRSSGHCCSNRGPEPLFTSIISNWSFGWFTSIISNWSFGCCNNFILSCCDCEVGKFCYSIMPDAG